MRRGAAVRAVAAGLAVVVSAGWVGASGQPGPGGGAAPTPGLRDAREFGDAVARSELRERALALLVEAAGDGSAQVRANAIEALHAAPTRAEPVVRAGLTDASPGVRFAAAFTVGKLGLRGLAEEARVLLGDADPLVRAAAIYALRRNGVEVDPTPLAVMLRGREPRERANAAFILGELGDASAAPMLREAAKDRRMPGTVIEQRLTRLQMAEALIKLGDRGAVDPVRAALYPVGPEDVEAATLAAQILGSVGDRAAAADLRHRIEARVETPGGRERPYLMPPELRLAAATALGRMGYRDAAWVADQHALDASPLVRAQAALTYAEQGGVAELPKLEAMLGDPEAVVRVAAAGAVVRAVDRLGGGR